MTASPQSVPARPPVKTEKEAGEDGGQPAPEEAAPEDTAAASPFEALCPVDVVDVALALPSQTPVLFLEEVDEPHRRLEIPIGLPEATAIAYALRAIATPKPLTHELFAAALAALDASIAVARITGQDGSAFYAEIVISGPGGLREIGCRPSDAVALALRQRPPAPIVAAAGLLGAGETAPRS
jgi:uncharacterized protein